MLIRMIHEDCNEEYKNDRTLPNSSYLVSYSVDKVIHYDIVSSNKRVDIFDYYWDLYRSEFLGYQQTEGRADPRSWTPSEKQKKTKK